jgi:hypothetical protein
MKTGRLSKEEQRQISRLIDSMTVEDIAKELDRRVEPVEKFVKNVLREGLSGIEAAAYSLEDRAYWPQIQNSFETEELELFKYHWTRIISQFRDDVLPTEELQIIDVIKLEILMSRSLANQKKNIEELNIQEAMLAIEREKDREDQDTDLLLAAQRQIAGLRAAQESLSKDLLAYQDKKARMLREIKGTREQRVKRLEESKQSFTAWVSTLMQDPDLMKKYGIEMEKMRLAMEKEKERLGKFHKYEDGTVDRPFLSADTVDKDDEDDE